MNGGEDVESADPKDCPIHQGACTEYNSHHLLWPRKHYNDPISRRYRQLFTVRICVDWHSEIHATTQPPRKPSRAEMLEILIQHGITIKGGSHES